MDNNIIWKDILINNQITSYEVNNIGQIRNKKTNKILKPYITHNGYLNVKLFINKRKIHKYIHRLVAIAFISNPENKLEINHIDGNKLNNNVENLEWCTRSENVKHAHSNGLNHSKFGSDCHFAICTDDQIHLVCKLLERKVPMKLIVNIIKINYNIIISIKIKRTWNNISLRYNIPKKYNYKTIKYSRLKKILIELNIFNTIDLLELLESKYIIKKKKLINDLELLGYEIFLYKYEMDKIYGKDEEN